MTLEELSGIDSEKVAHAPVESCEEAAEARGLEESQIVKSLIVEAGTEYHVLLPGDRTLSEKKFDPSTNVKMVDPERSLEVTGQKSGTVHPFSSSLPHVADERIFEQEKVSFTTGTDTEGVILDADDLKDALENAEFDLEIRDIVVSAEEDYLELEQEGVGREDARFVVHHGFRRVLSEIEASPRTAVTAVKKLEREDAEVSPEVVDELVERAENDTHMQKLAEHYASEGEFPEEKEFDLGEEVDAVLEENPGAVEDYRGGQESAINYLLGQVMQRTGGKADGNAVRKKLGEKL